MNQSITSLFLHVHIRIRAFDTLESRLVALFAEEVEANVSRRVHVSLPALSLLTDEVVQQPVVCRLKLKHAVKVLDDPRWAVALGYH